MKKAGSGRAVGSALLVMGLVIGGGLVFTLNFVYDVLTPRTITTTWTETSIVVITIPSTITTTGYAQIEPSVTSCAWNGAHEFCVVVLKNFGNMGTATSGNCSLSYGGSTYAGYTGPTQASAAHPGAAQQLVPGSTVTTYCQASAGGAAGAAAQVNGSIALANGATVSFSTTASS